MTLRQFLCLLGFHTWVDTLTEGQWTDHIRRDCACCASSHVRIVD